MSSVYILFLWSVLAEVERKLISLTLNQRMGKLGPWGFQLKLPPVPAPHPVPPLLNVTRVHGGLVFSRR